MSSRGQFNKNQTLWSNSSRAVPEEMDFHRVECFVKATAQHEVREQQKSLVGQCSSLSALCLAPSPLPAGQVEQELPGGSYWEALGQAQCLSEASSWLSGVDFWSWGEAAAFSVSSPWPPDPSQPLPPGRVSYSVLSRCPTACPCQTSRSAQLFCLTSSRLCDTTGRDGLLPQETYPHRDMRS